MTNPFIPLNVSFISKPSKVSCRVYRFSAISLSLLGSVSLVTCLIFARVSAISSCDSPKLSLYMSLITLLYLSSSSFVKPVCACNELRAFFSLFALVIAATAEPPATPNTEPIPAAVSEITSLRFEAELFTSSSSFLKLLKSVFLLLSSRFLNSSSVSESCFLKLSS